MKVAPAPAAQIVAYGLGTTPLADGPAAPAGLEPLQLELSREQREALIHGYAAGLTSPFEQDLRPPQAAAALDGIVKAFARAPHEPLAKIGYLAGLTASLALQRAGAVTHNRTVSYVGELGWTASTLAGSLLRGEAHLPGALLGFANLAADGAVLAAPTTGSFVARAQAAADLVFGEPGALAQIADLAALQVSLTGVGRPAH